MPEGFELLGAEALRDILAYMTAGYGDYRIVDLRHLGTSTTNALYDLERDPRESKNLFAEHPEVVEELRGVLRRFVERGRSTPGQNLTNDGPAHWKQLPWPKPGA